MTSIQLFHAMSPALAADILEHAFSADKEVYRATLSAIAQARKVRPVYLERQPRADRHRFMAATLGRQGMELIASNLLTSWLRKKQNAMLIDFLDALGVKHEKGVVENLPDKVEDTALNSAVDTLLSKYPQETVAVYLQAFYTFNNAPWPNLEALLQNDSRLKLGPATL